MPGQFHEAVLELRRQARFCKRMGDADANRAYLMGARHLAHVDRVVAREQEAARELKIDSFLKRRTSATCRHGKNIGIACCLCHGGWATP